MSEDELSLDEVPLAVRRKSNGLVQWHKENKKKVSSVMTKKTSNRSVRHELLSMPFGLIKLQLTASLEPLRIRLPSCVGFLDLGRSLFNHGLL